MTNKIYFGLLLLFLAGCGGENYTADGIATMQQPIHDQTEVYLLSAVDSRNSLSELNNTEYHVWLNGDYLGKWNASQKEPFNYSLPNNTGTTLHFPLSLDDYELNPANETSEATFILEPYDELELFITADNLPYPERIKVHIPDRAAHFIKPELYIPREYDFDYKVLDRDYQDLRYINNTYGMKVYDHIYLEVDIEGTSHRFTHFCCEYDSGDLYVSLMDFDLSQYPADSLECKGPIYSFTDDFSLYIETKYFENQTNVTCTFIDTAYYVNEDAEIIEGTYNHDTHEDIGLPNPSFTIKIEKED